MLYQMSRIRDTYLCAIIKLMIERKNKPLISVIMPVYNAEQHLRESIDSMLRQTYEHFELIIINDGSTDASDTIIRRYEESDKRIIYKKQSNQGVVGASNLGVSLAKGDYLMRTDADDVSFANKLADLIDTTAKHPDAVVISGNIEVIDENGEFMYKQLLPTESADIKRAMYIRNPLANGATLVKKAAMTAVGGYDNVFAEDFHLWVKLHALGEFVGTDTMLYRWRTNSTGLTMSNNEMSLKKEKEYARSLWSVKAPTYVNRRYIRARLRKYGQFAKHSHEYRRIFLDDISRIAIHSMKHGYVWLGTRQLFGLGTSGVPGFIAAVRRLSYIVRGIATFRQ